MSEHRTRKLFGYAKGILETQTGRPPTTEEMLMFLRSEAARINQGIESVSALSERQMNRLTATLRGYMDDAMSKAEADSPWASSRQRNYYRGLCEWAGWSKARRDGFLEHATGISSINFRVPKKQMRDCIEGAAQIMARESGRTWRQVKQDYRASRSKHKSAGGQ